MPRSLPTPAPTTDDDIVLVAQAKRDRQAFARLYRRYVEAVYRYCYRHLGSQEDAEDATSQVFTRALTALPRLGEQPFRAWLFTIAHNVVTDVYRNRSRVPWDPPPASSRGAKESEDPDPTPEHHVLAAEQGRSIRALLAQLPEDSRRLLELRLAGLNDVEIARVLGRSHGAVRVAQHRAVARLRALRAAAEAAESADA
jgi:RNA polymerase sigma-70 factor (ECF subfamily)